MAIVPEQLFGPETARRQALRAFPAHDGIRPGTLAAQGTVDELPNLLPLHFDETTMTWKIFVGESSEIHTMTAHAATPATAGDFTLTFNGETTAAIPFNATAAQVQAALEALPNVEPGDVTAVATTGANLGAASAVVTLNWGGQWAGEDVVLTANQTGISAGSDFVLATGTAGGTAAAGTTGVIDGFLWAPDQPHVPSTTGETLIQVFRAGSVHRDDIPIITGGSQLDLDEALLASDLREKNIEILGLAGIH
jgi:hypothetical protein